MNPRRLDPSTQIASFCFPVDLYSIFGNYDLSMRMIIYVFMSSVICRLYGLYGGSEEAVSIEFDRVGQLFCILVDEEHSQFI